MLWIDELPKALIFPYLSWKNNEQK